MMSKLINFFLIFFSLNYVFKGPLASYIDVILTPINYVSIPDDISLKGYKANFKKYRRGSIVNNMDFFEGGKHVVLRFRVNLSYFFMIFYIF